MGILDEAIREHLDLKRRRGADPTEIERAEREALGPVRRGPEPAAEDVALEEADDEPQLEHEPPEPERPEPVYEDNPEPRALEEHDELPPYGSGGSPAGDPLTDEEPFAGEARGTVLPDPADVAPSPEPEPALPPHPADPPPAPDPSRQGHEPPSHLDQETEEYELEPEHEQADDVLETTPEFLQDAPEHDRLWFEQRPPRDFDFDG
jgi:hypothetical protein